MKKMIVMGMIVTAMAVLIGCGGPPQEEIAKAEAAKASADAAKANIYVKDAYGLASMAWNDGEAAVKAKEWDKARKAYADAARQFDEAAKGAPAGHNAMKKELTDRMLEKSKKHQEMEKEIFPAMKKMTKDNEAKARKLIEECEAATQAAEEALAKDDLAAAKEKMDSDDIIDKNMMALVPAKK